MLQSSGKREPELKKKMPISNWLVGRLWVIFLIDDWFGNAQPTEDGTIPKQVILECIRSKISEPWRENLFSSKVLASVPD